MTDQAEEVVAIAAWTLAAWPAGQPAWISIVDWLCFTSFVRGGPWPDDIPYPALLLLNARVAATADQGLVELHPGYRPARVTAAGYALLDAMAGRPELTQLLTRLAGQLPLANQPRSNDWFWIAASWLCLERCQGSRLTGAELDRTELTGLLPSDSLSSSRLEGIVASLEKLRATPA